MKKILIIALIAFSGIANAQKNTLLVGGNIGFSSQKDEVGNSEVKTNSFELSPTIGYQFNDNWTVGLNASTGSSKIDNGTIEQKSNNFKVGPFVRYAQSLGGAFAVYGDLGVGYQKSKTETANITTSDAKGVYVGFTPALFINFKNSFGLNFSIGGLGYNTMKDNDSDSKTSSFDFNFGKTVNIGISKNFTL